MPNTFTSFPEEDSESARHARDVAIDLILGYLGRDEGNKTPAERGAFTAEILTDKLGEMSQLELLQVIDALSFFAGCVTRLAAQLVPVANEADIDLDDWDDPGDPLDLLTAIQEATDTMAAGEPWPPQDDDQPG